MRDRFVFLRHVNLLRARWSAMPALPAVALVVILMLVSAKPHTSATGGLDLSITDVVGQSAYKVGDLVTYTLTVANGAAADPIMSGTVVSVADLVAIGLTNVTASSSGWSIVNTNSTSPSLITATYTGPYPIAAGTTLPTIIVQGVATESELYLGNSAAVIVTDDLNPTNNSATAATVINAAAPLLDTATPSPSTTASPIPSDTATPTTILPVAPAATPISAPVVATVTSTAIPTTVITAVPLATATAAPATATATINSPLVVHARATLQVHNERRTVVGGRMTPCNLAGNTNGRIQSGCEIVSSVWKPGATVTYRLRFADGTTLTFVDTADANGHSLHPFAIAYRPAAGAAGPARSVAFIKVSATASDGTTGGPSTVRFAVSN